MCAFNNRCDDSTNRSVVLKLLFFANNSAYQRTTTFIKNGFKIERGPSFFILHFSLDTFQKIQQKLNIQLDDINFNLFS